MTIVRYTAWLGLQGAVAAGSLQPYHSAVNKFFKDQQQPPVAVAELVVEVSRGLEIR
jgi:hypothetical protein